MPTDPNLIWRTNRGKTLLQKRGARKGSVPQPKSLSSPGLVRALSAKSRHCLDDSGQENHGAALKPLPQEIRNPWRGINMWREFKWDMRHPNAMRRRALLGMKGQNPLVSGHERLLGLAFVVVGLIQVVGGVAALLVAYGVLG